MKTFYLILFTCWVALLTWEICIPMPVFPPAGHFIFIAFCIVFIISNGKRVLND